MTLCRTAFRKSVITPLYTKMVRAQPAKRASDHSPRREPWGYEPSLSAGRDPARRRRAPLPPGPTPTGSGPQAAGEECLRRGEGPARPRARALGYGISPLRGSLRCEFRYKRVVDAGERGLECPGSGRKIGRVCVAGQIDAWAGGAIKRKAGGGPAEFGAGAAEIG